MDPQRWQAGQVIDGFVLERALDPGGMASFWRVSKPGTELPMVMKIPLMRRGEDPISQLTPREREVLELMAEGRSNQAIAEKLVVTLRAVEKHVTSIFGKLRLPADEADHRRVLAVLTYLRQ